MNNRDKDILFLLRLIISVLVLWLGLVVVHLKVEAVQVYTIPDPPVPAASVVRKDVEPEVDISCLRCCGYTGEQGYDGLTASGTQVCEGTLAGPREWIDRECYLYDMEGNLIGEFTFLDTGNPKYVNAERIDMWFEYNSELKQFQKDVGDYVQLEWRYNYEETEPNTSCNVNSK